SGVHFALDFLQQQNRRVAGEPIVEPEITARGKHVLVIGGGDTGSDCVGTSVRQGAASVTQIEILPKPPEGENPDTPWPYWPQVLKSSSSHEEGCERRWSLASKAFVGNAKRQVTGVEVVEVAFTKGADGRMQMTESQQRETLKADLVLLAMGFVHVRHEGLVQMLEVATDSRGNIAVDANGQTSNPKLFAVGDAASGASLVVRAIAGGLQTATAMDQFLKNNG
ncbi:MAG: FAD-dependent oxidoreductase, partial [Bacteroidales bacterium]